MFAKVMCPGCKYQFSIPEGDMGKRQVCPNCRSPFLAGKSETEGTQAPAPAFSAPAYSAPASAAPPAFAKTMLGETGPAIKYNCPRCKTALESPVSEAGIKKPCPSCGQRLQVPNPPPAPAPSAAAPRLDKTMLASDERAAPPLPPIRYNCPNCKRPLEAAAVEANTKKNCPSCGQRHQIPAAPAAAGGPNLNKTMLAGDGSSQPVGAAAYASYGTPGSAAAPGAPGAPGAAPTTPPPMIAGVPVTGKNIAIAVGALLLLLYVVPALIRGGRADNTAEIAKIEEKRRKDEEEFERAKKEVEKHQAYVAEQKEFFAKVRRTLDDLAKDARDQESRMRRNYEDAIASADDTQKAVLKKKFDAEQRRIDEEKRAKEREHQKTLEEIQTKLAQKERELQTAREQEQNRRAIVTQPVVVPQPVYYPPYDPYYWRPWWLR
ncbi:MAG: hypothetical protein FJ271_09850 [Planctomycetes bacterium]|nr:hypothetical protein [Planctomycetota bacterium]